MLCLYIECFNRYEPLTQLDYSNEAVSSSSNSDEKNDGLNVDVDLVGIARQRRWWETNGKGD